MKVFLLKGKDNGQETIQLTGHDFHYICRVLRKNEGDHFLCRFQTGPIYQAHITGKEETRCLLKLEKTDKEIPKKNYDIILVQGIPKGKKMDMIVRQATEVGVSAIIPVFTQYTVVKIDAQKDRENKRKRWEKIIREASQQSGNSKPPVIYTPIQISEMPGLLPSDFLGFVFHQDAEDAPGIHKILGRCPDAPVAVCIGPEGGFSPEEIQFLTENGFQTAYCGPLVMRTETAGLYAVSAIQNVQGVFLDGSDHP